MKSENKLEEYFRKSKYLYQIIVDINHSNRAEILLDVAKVIDFSNRNTWSSFRKIVRESSGQDLIELRITLLEEFGILVDLSFSKIKKHYPERTLAAVMKILNALEKDECRSLIGHRTLNPSDFRAFIKFIKEESLSPEKYINWALRSNKSIDPFSILNISIENPFPTSKIEILNLTKLSDLSDIKEPKMKYRDILQSLLAYELSNSERNELKQWSKSVKENFTYTRFDSHKRSKNEEYELKLGIQL